MDAMLDREDLKMAEPERVFPSPGVAGMAYRCLNDSEWTMLWVSEGCRELTGYEVADVVGNRAMSWAQLIYPEDRLEVSLEVQTALEDRRPFQLTYRIRRANGELIWVWEQGHGVSSKEGKLVCIEGLITSVSP